LDPIRAYKQFVILRPNTEHHLKPSKIGWKWSKIIPNKPNSIQTHLYKAIQNQRNSQKSSKITQNHLDK
jgi:hypothetical protein